MHSHSGVAEPVVVDSEASERALAAVCAVRACMRACARLPAPPPSLLCEHTTKRAGVLMRQDRVGAAAHGLKQGSDSALWGRCAACGQREVMCPGSLPVRCPSTRSRVCLSSRVLLPLVLPHHQTNGVTRIVHPCIVIRRGEGGMGTRRTGQDGRGGGRERGGNKHTVCVVQSSRGGGNKDTTRWRSPAHPEHRLAVLSSGHGLVCMLLLLLRRL